MLGKLQLLRYKSSSIVCKYSKHVPIWLWLLGALQVSFVAAGWTILCWVVVVLLYCRCCCWLWLLSVNKPQYAAGANSKEARSDFSAGTGAQWFPQTEDTRKLAGRRFKTNCDSIWRKLAAIPLQITTCCCAVYVFFYQFVMNRVKDRNSRS